MKVDVQHLAKLAQMSVSLDEVKKLETGFEQTLKVVAELDELDTKKVKPTSQVTGLTNVFRKDQIDKDRMLTQDEALSNAKKKYRGYFVVPAILSPSKGGQE
jgi:aspartyl/glutamyl-tRNA(Asn/Gln) amidotransferase C subunit